MGEDWRSVNGARWDELADMHAASAGYGFDRFVTDPRHLSDVVAFDSPRLGALRGVRGLHLQCHIGTDTLSLSRLGATMSGLDFSAPSLVQERRLAKQTGVARLRIGIRRVDRARQRAVERVAGTHGRGRGRRIPAA